MCGQALLIGEQFVCVCGDDEKIMLSAPPLLIINGHLIQHSNDFKFRQQIRPKDDSEEAEEAEWQISQQEEARQHLFAEAQSRLSGVWQAQR